MMAFVILCVVMVTNLIIMNPIHSTKSGIQCSVCVLINQIDSMIERRSSSEKNQVYEHESCSIIESTQGSPYIKFDSIDRAPNLRGNV